MALPRPGRNTQARGGPACCARKSSGGPRRSSASAALLALCVLVASSSSRVAVQAQGLFAPASPPLQAPNAPQWGPYEGSYPSAGEADGQDSLYQSVDEENLAPPAPEFDFPIAQTTRIPYTSAFLSKFWGVSGEKFSYTDRMADWSWAGYRAGEQSIPYPSYTYNLVSDFGAKPNDNTPDTAAFQAAFTRVPPGGVLFIPAGRYIVDQKLVRTSSIVIRGAGRDQTTVYFSKCLNDLTVKPWQSTAADPLSPYRDYPYMITLQGTVATSTATLLASVSSDAKRGATAVQVSLAPGAALAQGMMVRFVASDKNLELVTYMYGGMTEDDMRRPASDVKNANNLLVFSSRLASWKAGAGGVTTLTLDRPLAFDLRPSAWRNVQMHSYPSTMLTETGVEDITFEFKHSTYPGHLIEMGYNTLGIIGCLNCWARRLSFLNIDFGIHIEQSAYMTVEDLVYSNNTDRSAGNLQRFDGHHAVRLARATDVLVRHLNVKNKFIHDVTVDVSAVLNVYHNVTALDLSMDFHSRAPTMNLMSRMNCGKCMRPWASGGSATSGAHAGMLNMAWGLTGRTPTTYMEPMWLGFAQSFTIVGAPLSRIPSFNNLVVEAVDPAVLQPWDLQASQLQWRLSRVRASAVQGGTVQTMSSSLPHKV